MKVEHFGGTDLVEDEDSLDRVLAARYGDGVNEYWFSRDGAFPSMALMVSGMYAVLHYFPEDGHPGYCAVGRPDELDPAGSLSFRTNTPTEEILVSNRLVVRLATVRSAVHEFFSSGALPSSLKWMEL